MAAVSHTPIPIHWFPEESSFTLSASKCEFSLLPQIGRPRIQERCPCCHSIIYSRRHRLCGACGEPLPDECLFPVPEALRIEALLSTEKQKHRRWLARVRGE